LVIKLKKMQTLSVKTKFDSLPLELQEHGFLRELFKRCRTNSKRLEDIEQSEAKQKSGAKLTAAQLEKVSRKEQFSSAIQADLEMVDLFVRHH
jgi:hypothetical protein